jgi:hypothetical protein
MYTKPLGRDLQPALFDWIAYIETLTADMIVHSTNRLLKNSGGNSHGMIP